MDHIELRKCQKESQEIKNMFPGVERRKRILALLDKGYKIPTNREGLWNTKDKDLQYLFKKRKIKTTRVKFGGLPNIRITLIVNINYERELNHEYW